MVYLRYLIWLFGYIHQQFHRRHAAVFVRTLPTGVIQRQITYCSIRQSKEMIKDIISGAVSPRQDPLRKDSGADSLDEYEKRSRQICGMTCLQMILKTIGTANVPGNIALAKQSLLYGTYRYDPRYNRPTDYHISPMQHVGFMHFVREEYGLHCEVLRSVSLAYVVQRFVEGSYIMLSLNGNPRTTSLSPGYKRSPIGRHLVLMTGYEIENGKLVAITIHNGSGYRQNQTQEYVRFPLAVIEQYFTGNVLIV